MLGVKLSLDERWEKEKEKETESKREYIREREQKREREREREKIANESRPQPIETTEQIYFYLAYILSINQIQYNLSVYNP